MALEIRLCCAMCKKVVELSDQVILNELYTISHQSCEWEYPFPTKDSGTFEEMLNKYSFLTASI